MAHQTGNLVFSPFSALKTLFLGKNGIKIQIFENSEKVLLDILEIHVVSKFGLVPMKIVAGSLSEHSNKTNNNNDGHFGTPVYQYTIIPLYSTTNRPT